MLHGKSNISYLSFGKLKIVTLGIEWVFLEAWRGKMTDCVKDTFDYEMNEAVVVWMRNSPVGSGN